MFRKGLLIAALALVLDQLHKYYMLYIYYPQAECAPGMPCGLFSPFTQSARMEITSFFDLVMVWNKGVSFGILNGAGGEYQALLLSVIALAVVGLLLWWLTKSDNLWNAAGIGLVVGGAVGNVIDRMLYGAVADFFDVHFGDFHWPAFNVADSFICIGVFMLVTEGIFDKKKSHENK